MKIVRFEKKYISQATELALANYYEERQAVPELPEEVKFPELEEFAENGLGVAAVKNGTLVGFLCCLRPWSNAFGSTAEGTFSPIHAHGAVKENRADIYRRLYQAAAKLWVEHRITSHAVALYAHDKEALQAFFLYGFGARCVDAVRGMKEVTCPPVIMDFKRLPKEEITKIRELRRGLSRHLGESPCFMVSGKEEFEQWLARAEQRDTLVYVAESDEKITAFLEIGEDGENFVTESEGMKNICGAFCLPEYRGSGVFANLLQYAIDELGKQGIRLLGVDYESINPTAMGAWGKYFMPYTYSVVRRIEEGALRNIQPESAEEYNVRNNDRLRASFNNLTRKTFGFDFKKWYGRGYWQDKYIPYVKVVDDEVVSNVSVNIMDFLVNGKVKHFLQIGTVMTDAEHQGKGYNRELMEKVLAEYKDKMDGIYLFGNDSVLEYYPKFGFRPAMEYEYSRSIRKDVTGYAVEKTDMRKEEEAERFFAAIRAGAVNDGLHMCDNLGLYQFWLADSKNIYYLPEMDGYVVAEEEAGRLTVIQVFGTRELDLDRVAAALVRERKSNAEEFVLGFTPADKTGYRITEHKKEDCTLFLLGEGLEKLMKEKVMFPILSHA